MKRKYDNVQITFIDLWEDNGDICASYNYSFVDNGSYEAGSTHVEISLSQAIVLLSKTANERNIYLTEILNNKG